MQRVLKVVCCSMVVCFLAAMLLAFCPVAKADEQDGKVVIDFWSFWGSATRRPIVEKIVSDFNKSQSKIFVKYTYLPWGDIWTKNLASIAAGHPADVVINDIANVPYRAINKQNTNLAQFVTPEIQKSFFPELWKTVLYKGAPYAIPFNTDTRVLFYNKKAFKEAGLDPNKPPQTWDELWAYAEKLDKKSGNKYSRIGFYPLWNLGAEIWMFNADKGMGWFDYANGEDVKINTPAKVKALKWIQKWNEKYTLNTINMFKAEFGSQQAHPFLSGKVAMFCDVASFYTQIRDYGKNMEFGVAQLPEMVPGNGHWSWGAGFVAEIPNGSKHPKEAFEFIKYLTGPAAQEYWAVKNFDNIANVKASMKAINNPELNVNGKLVFAKSVQSLEKTIMVPVPLTAPEYWTLINPNIDAVLMGKMSAEDALNRAQKDVEDLIKANKARK